MCLWISDDELGKRCGFLQGEIVIVHVCYMFGLLCACICVSLP